MKKNKKETRKNGNWSEQDDAFFGPAKESSEEASTGSNSAATKNNNLKSAIPKSSFSTSSTRTRITTQSSSTRFPKINNNNKTNTNNTRFSQRSFVNELQQKESASASASPFSFKNQKEHFSSFASKASTKIKQQLSTLELTSRDAYPAAATARSRAFNLTSQRQQEVNQNNTSLSKSSSNLNPKKMVANPSILRLQQKQQHQQHHQQQQQQNNILSSQQSKKNKQNTMKKNIKNVLLLQVPLPCIYCNAIPLMITYHPFYGATQRVCATHDFQSLPKCMACSRIQPKNQKFHEIGSTSEGCLLCPICAETAILDNVAAREVYQEILCFFQSYGLDMMFDYDHGGSTTSMLDVPINLVSRQAMKNFQQQNKDEHTFDFYGVCCWQEGYNPVIGVAIDTVNVAARSVKDFLKSRKKNVKKDNSSKEESASAAAAAVPRNRGRGAGKYVIINEIAVLKGLPRIYLAQVLAHEATHAWFGLNPLRRDGVVGEQISMSSIRRIPMLVEEGCCQLVSHLYLDYLTTNNDLNLKNDTTIIRNRRQNINFWNKTTTATTRSTGASSSLSFSDDDKNLIQYLLQGIETHNIFEYGEGYKQAAHAYNHICECGGNLEDLLQYVSMHRSFPPS